VPLLFAVTLFVSASLLFMVQPMVGKMVLPLLGGSPAVWNACMVFFQALLLLGYLYAHWVTTKFRTRKQWAIHTAVLGAPIAVMAVAALLSGRHTPIAIAESFAPTGESSSILYVLASVMALLTVAIGIPFFVSSTSAPLIQKWFAETGHPSARDPYFLYAASNAGSLIALLGYPLVIEPNLSVVGQTWLWAVGFVVLAGFVVVCGNAAANPVAVPPPPAKLPATKGKPGESTAGAEAGAGKGAAEPPPSGLRKAKWVVLAFVPSSLMLGVTFHMTTDIASIPLLWVGPLALYLVTFIIAFSTILPPWFRLVVGNLSPVMILLLVFVIISGAVGRQVGLELLLHLLAFFAAALMCHYELARDRPGTEYLTGYFLLMSLGGVLGGLFNALIAPLIFPQDYEYKIALVLACFLVPRLSASPKKDDPTTPLAPRPFRESAVTFAITAAVFLIVGVVGYLTLGLASSVELWYLVSLLVAWALVGVWAAVPQRLDPTRRIVGAPPSTFTRLAARSRATDWAAVLDAALPFTVGVAFQLLFWLSQVEEFQRGCQSLANTLKLETSTILLVVVYAVPVMVCFFFVDRPIRFGLSVAVILAMSAYRDRDRDLVHSERSFFGILKVERQISPQYPFLLDENGRPVRDDDGIRKGAGRIEYLRLVHGTTLHGTQIRRLENNVFDYFQQLLPPTPSPLDAIAATGAIQKFNAPEEPLTYYHRTGPVGAMFRELRQRKGGADAKADVAMVGLGTGSVSCYALPGQKLTFYEIDPAVRNLVEPPTHFTYVDDAKKRGATIDFRMGDARLKLNEDVDARYTLLLVDAFSSDSIPVHLLTLEAVQLYFNRMPEDGILALHISNKFVKLEPVVARIAEDLGVAARVWNDDGERGPGKTASSWVVLARKEEYLGGLARSQPEQVAQFIDDRAPLLEVYRSTTNPKEAKLLDLLKEKYGSRAVLAIDLLRNYKASSPLKLLRKAETTPMVELVERLRAKYGQSALLRTVVETNPEAADLRPLLKNRGDSTTLQQVWEDIGGLRVELLREWVEKYAAGDPDLDEKDPHPRGMPLNGAILFEFGPAFLDVALVAAANPPERSVETALLLKYGQMFRPLEIMPDVPTWTDDYSDVLRVMMIPELQRVRKFMGLKTPVER
jgi:hypothetical protein